MLWPTCGPKKLLHAGTKKRHTDPCLFILSSSFVLSPPGDCRIQFSAVYNTVGFKEASAKVYLPTVPITARIMEVERFTTAQDRFNLSQHRSVNKVQLLVLHKQKPFGGTICFFHLNSFFFIIFFASLILLIFFKSCRLFALFNVFCLFFALISQYSLTSPQSFVVCFFIFAWVSAAPTTLSAGYVFVI